MDQRVVVATGASTAIVEAYDPQANRWELLAPLDFPRTLHTAVLMSDGRVLVTGGMAGTRNERIALSTIYDPTTNAWTSAAALPVVTSDVFAAASTRRPVPTLA